MPSRFPDAWATVVYIIIYFININLDIFRYLYNVSL